MKSNDSYQYNNRHAPPEKDKDGDTFQHYRKRSDDQLLGTDEPEQSKIINITKGIPPSKKSHIEYTCPGLVLCYPFIKMRRKHKFLQPGMEIWTHKNTQAEYH